MRVDSEAERQKYRQTRKQIFSGLPRGAQAFWACPSADISRGSRNPHRAHEPRRVGKRKKTREGQGGEKMEGEGIRMGVQHL